MQAIASAVERPVRILFQAGLAIFVITVLFTPIMGGSILLAIAPSRCACRREPRRAP